ncbi:hypothetical protein CBR_g38033 [Chara braunii]|uniref:Uncharacterized protein n=1 Tax=Chara braunii TaxID=69332 RepID=A0A388K018_CHABU|nr:hypothetical protein CBR_g38033 [Chara braunii]|eukprot:GBG63411.1 hypothetical protein CBR_g38033 [Chara braunii]
MLSAASSRPRTNLWSGYVPAAYGGASMKLGQAEIGGDSRDQSCSSRGQKKGAMEYGDVVEPGPSLVHVQGCALGGRGEQCDCCRLRRLSEAEAAAEAVPSEERYAELVGAGKVQRDGGVLCVVESGKNVRSSSARHGKGEEGGGGLVSRGWEADARRNQYCERQSGQCSCFPFPEREGSGGVRERERWIKAEGGRLGEKGGGGGGGDGKRESPWSTEGGGEKGGRQCTRLLKGVLTGLAIFVLVQYCFLKSSEYLLTRANALGRQCHKPHDYRHYAIADGRFAMVTCSDGASTIPKRSFKGLAEMVTPNKEKYVKKHGYDFIDASDLVDRHRPPSWSKILAVKKHLRSYDWVFWTDADSVVTNPEVTLQEVVASVIATGLPPLSRGRKAATISAAALGNVGIQQQDQSEVDLPDFIVTEDQNGVNAGMFFVRNSTWSHEFLELWWSQSRFVRPFGRCKSGDNDALKHLIATMDDAERRRHVRVPVMQCAFNSNLWRPSVVGSKRLLLQTKAVWRGVFAKGDFMVHLAGVDNKKKYMSRVLRELDRDRDGDRATEVSAGRRAQGYKWQQDELGGSLHTWRRKLGSCPLCNDQALL